MEIAVKGCSSVEIILPQPEGTDLADNDGRAYLCCGKAKFSDRSHILLQMIPMSLTVA